MYSSIIPQEFVCCQGTNLLREWDFLLTNLLTNPSISGILFGYKNTHHKNPRFHRRSGTAHLLSSKERYLPEQKRFLSLEDLSHLPPPEWLIDGLFEKNSVIMLAGPPGSYKSFLALDWSLCLATNNMWCGHKVVENKVLYILGEGKSSLLKRVNAWLSFHRLGAETQEKLEQNFRACFSVPQFASEISVNKLLRDLETEDFEPTVIIIDTLARSHVGRSENDPQDIGLWIESADRLRHMGHTIIVIHHTRKNSEFGLVFRGSTAIEGGVDTAFMLSKDKDAKDLVKLDCTKQKEHDDNVVIWLKRNIAFNSVILTVTNERPQDRIDEREEQEAQIDKWLADLLKSTDYTTDRERARVLASNTTLSEGAAQTRISRARRKSEGGDA